VAGLPKRKVQTDITTHVVDIRESSYDTSLVKKRSSVNSSIPRPTEAELSILNVLWQRGPATVREVYDTLTGKEIGYTTVLKQMQVMADKGLLKRSERFRSHVYTTRAPREETQRKLAGNLLRQAFSGSASGLVLGALSSSRVSASELAAIRQLLDSYEKETL
jgi:BlaI family penicillinase repressor